MTVSFSLLDEFKATVWRQARVLDRGSLPSFPGGVSYLSAAPTRPSRAACEAPHGESGHRRDRPWPRPAIADDLMELPRPR